MPCPAAESRTAYVTHAQWVTAVEVVRSPPPHTQNSGVLLLDPIRSGFAADDRVLATWSESRAHEGNPEGVDHTTLVAVHPDGAVTLVSAGEPPAATHVEAGRIRTKTIHRWLWLGEPSAVHSLRSDITLGALP